jgi:ABC-2 type transport system ATP-binding protein
MSSHLITDLERVCDHIIALTASRLQLCGDIETLVAEHKVLRRTTHAVSSRPR